MDGDAVMQLANALVSTFGLIGLGYAGRLQLWLGPDAAPGIGKLCGAFALPALLLRSVATVDLQAVNASVVGGVLVAKLVVGGLAGALGFLTAKTEEKSLVRAGMFALFVTNEGATAVGLPLVTALYDGNDVDFVAYLYLLAALQCCVITPIALVLIEFGKRGGMAVKGGMSAVLQDVAVETLLNPLVSATLFGLVINGATSAYLPEVVTMFLDTLGACFTGGVLLLTGMVMVGNARHLRGRGLILPTILSILKLLLMPVAMRYLTYAMLPPHTDHSTDILNFVFLYGSIPAAASSLVISRYFNAEVGLVAGSLVLCTAVSAPLMFMTSVLFSNGDEDTLFDIVSRVSTYMHSLGIFGAIFVAMGLALMASWRKYPMASVCVLAVVQVAFHTSHIVCNEAGSMDSYVATTFFRLLARNYLFGMVMIMLRDLHWSQKAREGCPKDPHQGTLSAIVFIVCTLYSLLTSLLLYQQVGGVEEEDSPALQCWYRFRFEQKVLDVVLMSVQIAALLYGAWFATLYESRLLLVQRRGTTQSGLDLDSRQAAPSQGDEKAGGVLEEKQTAASGARIDEGRLEKAPARDTYGTSDVNASGPLGRTNPYLHMGMVAENLSSDASALSRETSADDFSSAFPTPAPLDTSLNPVVYPAEVSLASPASSTTSLLQSPESGRQVCPDASFRFRVQILMIQLIIRLILQLCLTISILNSEDMTGSVDQMLFISVVLVDAQGFLTFLVFGFQDDYLKKLLSTISSLANSCVCVGKEEADGATHQQLLSRTFSDGRLSQEELAELAQLVSEIRSVSGLVRVRNWGFQGQRGRVVIGSDLVTYLVANHYCQNRSEAAQLGRSLMRAGFLFHVENDEEFKDGYYFYGLRPSAVVSTEE
uniref:DEP domain-containing protein n=1 Tax=Pinguiococcus pyrenoidosus TaxID=172671 RepID=A0A7R9U8Y7_9STRA|mmetsp:Transcript_17767/g.67486  ORF Transcript_17767/g.67486 Transcript_17767/m.67486 type:complete len:879 (+) Transcript_17767:100-2736(+)